MKTKGKSLVVTLAAAIFYAWLTPSIAQELRPGDAAYGQALVKAVLAAPGVLGRELGRTVQGKLVIFAGFEDKKALVDWYKSDFHMRGVRWAFPNQTFDREPLPDTPENSGQILALVTLQFADARRLAGPALHAWHLSWAMGQRSSRCLPSMPVRCFSC